MTKEQAYNLAHVLMEWSKGSSLEARDVAADDMGWYPFTPENYERVNVGPGIQWRVAPRVRRPISVP
jgi:hypothetical protein